MKKLLMGAVALAAMSTTPAFAVDPSANYQVQGTVDAACYANTGGTIDFGTMSIDSTTGRLNGLTSASSAGSNIWCNGINSTLSFTSTGLLTGSNSSGDTAFTNVLTFTPSVTLGGNAVTSGATIGAKYGSLVVTAGNLSDGGKLPVAGNYTGLITVTLTPAA
jgi:hypothetical protein